MPHTKSAPSKGPRFIALQVLAAVENEGAYASIALDNRLRGSGLDRRDRGFATELVYGTLRRRLTLDWVLGRFARRPLDGMPALIRNNLRMALYQILFLDKIPPAAACNEAVRLTRLLGFKGLAGFVNGLLRTLLRDPQRADYRKAAHSLPARESISLIHSHPLWLVDIWLEELGMEETVSLCEANNGTPPTFFRTNTLAITRDELIDGLRERGIKAVPGRLAPEAIEVEAPSDIAKLDLFQKGCFAVQDEGAMQAAHALKPQPGERIYDLCGGLGGKALHIAALMENKGEVVAFDIHGGKLQALGKMASRLGVINVDRVRADSTALPGEYLGRAHGVLLDAPCSGWGVLRRKPDLRWRSQREGAMNLVLLQRQLLETAYACLGPRGRLVYCTCTVHRRENEENVEWILAKHRNLALDGPMQQLLPHKHGTDGFFIATLVKQTP